MLAALGAAQPAAAAPNPAQRPLPSWQVLAPGWTDANKELGRVNAILRVGRTVYVGGNFTVMANHSGRVGDPPAPGGGERRHGQAAARIPSP